MAHDAPSAAPTRISADPTVRRLAGANFVSTLGNGLTMTLSALYFTQVVRIPVAHVGLALTVAGMFGVAASIQFGPIVDRLGSRRVMTLLLVGSAICSASLGLLHSFWPFLAVITATSVVSSGASTARATLYSHALPPEARTQARAFLRAVTNVGIGAGSALAAVALHLGTREAYVTAFLADALTFLAAAAILRGLPTHYAPDAPERGTRRGRNPALRDRPYLAVAALNAVLSLQFSIFEVGIPLWIVRHTDAPRVMVAVSMVINTVLVALFQVRAGRLVRDVGTAARLARRGGLILAAAWLILGLCAGLPGWLAAVLVGTALVVETAGEVITSAAGWELSYGLADDANAGAYQGVFQGGFSTATMAGPVVVTSTALHFGFVGWALLAAIFAAAGATLPPVARWAAAQRTARTGG